SYNAQAVNLSVDAEHILRWKQLNARVLYHVFQRNGEAGIAHPQETVWRLAEKVAINLTGLGLDQNRAEVVVFAVAGFVDVDVVLRGMELRDHRAPGGVAARFRPEPGQQLDFLLRALQEGRGRAADSFGRCGFGNAGTSACEEGSGSGSCTYLEEFAAVRVL